MTAAPDSPLWQKLQSLLSASPDGKYRADWTQFMVDTGGYTINSLVSYGLYAEAQPPHYPYGTGTIALRLLDYSTYEMWRNDGEVTA